jgi:uncharacterized protein YbjT (DUF2867 family)
VPITLLLTSFYWDNFIFFGLGPKRDANNNLAITFPLGDKKMASIAAEDIGKCAYGVFKQGPSLTGKTVGIVGEYLSGQEMADKMSKALGQHIIYNEVSPDTYRSFGFPGANDLGNMFQFYRDFSDQFNNNRSLSTSKELNPSLKTFDEWLQEYKEKIPIE